MVVVLVLCPLLPLSVTLSVCQGYLASNSRNWKLQHLHIYQIKFGLCIVVKCGLDNTAFKHSETESFQTAHGNNLLLVLAVVTSLYDRGPFLKSWQSLKLNRRLNVDVPS